MMIDPSAPSIYLLNSLFFTAVPFHLYTIADARDDAVFDSILNHHVYSLN